MQGSAISIISAITLGLSLGYILQRGRFCLNSAFRDIIFLDNLTTFRAYLLSVVVAIIGSNLIQDLGLMITPDPQTGEIVHTMLLRQNFVPLANILGGFLFGVGIVLAGGCASGIVFRLGEGNEKPCILAYFRAGPHGKMGINHCFISSSSCIHFQRKTQVWFD